MDKLEIQQIQPLQQTNEQQKLQQPAEEENKQNKQLSKKQQRKLERKAKSVELRKKKKILKKEKKKELRLQKQNNNEQQLLQKQENKIQNTDQNQKKLTSKEQREQYKNELKTAKPIIIIDNQFQHLLKEKELTSLQVQINNCHSVNRKAEKRVQLTITSYGGQLKESLTKQCVENWGINLVEKHYLDVYNKENLVYLTGDCDEDMIELDENKIYIIGGLVDHNRLKNTTANKAKEEGIKMIRFPLNKYIKFKKSYTNVLTVNHVFEILVKLKNGMSWSEALNSTLPMRKVEFIQNNEENQLSEEKINSEEKILKKVQIEQTETNNDLQQKQQNLNNGQNNQ